jgi:hypothetical protein
MDKLGVKYFANNDLEGYIWELLETRSRLTPLPQSYFGKDKMTPWVREMDASRVLAKLTGEEAWQLLFDIRQAYNKFSGILKEQR